jgi:hypothetical protein
VIARIAVLALVLLAACGKKEDAPGSSPGSASTSSAATGTARKGVGVVSGGLASTDGGALGTAKSSLVAQQCALACGVRPENDPGLCTQRCAKECMSASDIDGIDACAQRIAAPK